MSELNSLKPLLLLSRDRQSIPYRPRLARHLGSIHAAILLQQIVYRWSGQGEKPFFKFKKPCQHPQYRAGDSWCEELGFSRREFDSALKQIATRKTGAMTVEEAMETGKPVVYWCTWDRRAFYTVNPEALTRLLCQVYGNSSRPSSATSSHREPLGSNATQCKVDGPDDATDLEAQAITRRKKQKAPNARRFNSAGSPKKALSPSPREISPKDRWEDPPKGETKSTSPFTPPTPVTKRNRAARGVSEPPTANPQRALVAPNAGSKGAEPSTNVPRTVPTEPKTPNAASGNRPRSMAQVFPVADSGPAAPNAASNTTQKAPKVGRILESEKIPRKDPEKTQIKPESKENNIDWDRLKKDLEMYLPRHVYEQWVPDLGFFQQNGQLTVTGPPLAIRWFSGRLRRPLEQAIRTAAQLAGQPTPEIALWANHDDL